MQQIPMIMWHRVQDKLPEHLNEVLVSCGGCPVFYKAFYRHDLKKWRTKGDNGSVVHDVVAWAEVNFPENPESPCAKELREKIPSIIAQGDDLNYAATAKIIEIVNKHYPPQEHKINEAYVNISLENVKKIFREIEALFSSARISTDYSAGFASAQSACLAILLKFLKKPA